MEGQIKNLIGSKHYLNMPSFNNCDVINAYIKIDIEEDMPQVGKAYMAEGVVEDDEGRQTGHLFVYIPKDSHGGGSDLIVDGAIDQFTYENQESEEKSRAAFGSKKDFGPGGKYDSLYIGPLSASPFNHQIRRFHE